MAATTPQFKTFAEVEAWKQQYAEDEMRYKFLVLSGETGLGKTEFAKSLVENPESMLELNCANTLYPPMRHFSPVLHELILFDEISAQAIITNKKLFQAGPAWIHWRSSPTNNLIYQVMVHKVKMVVSTNSWEADLAAADEHDRRWLLGNSMVLKVLSPLWVERVDERGS